MEFMSQFLPIVIYILLILLIIIGIILGIKLIITVDKVLKIVDDVNDKIEKISPIFNFLGLASSKMTSIVESVVGTLENFVYKLFFKNKEEEKENDKNE